MMPTAATMNPMVNPTFVETLRELRTYWLGQINTLTTVPLDLMLPDLENIERNIKQCLALPQTREPETAVLINRALPLVERIGHFEGWVKLTHDALTNCTTLSQPLSIELLLTLGALYRRIGDLQEALYYHQDAKSRAESENIHSLLIAAHFHLCADYRAVSKLDRAEAAGQAALQLAKQTNIDTLFHSRIWHTYGLVAFFKGGDEDLIEAESRLQKALSLLPESAALNHAKLLNDLALILKAQNKYEESEQLLIKAINILEISTHELDKSRVYSTLGSIYFATQKWDKAEKLFREAFSQTVAHSDELFLKALLHQNIGNVLLRKKDYPQAEWMLGQAIILWQRLKKVVDLANSLGIMGELYALQNRNSDAIYRYERAITLLKPQAAQQARAKRLLEEFETSLARLIKEEGQK